MKPTPPPMRVLCGICRHPVEGKHSSVAHVSYVMHRAIYCGLTGSLWLLLVYMIKRMIKQ